MAKRPSNKERVQRKALEADLTAKERSDKKTTKATKSTKTSKKTTKTTKKTATRRKKVTAASGDRMKMIWKVFNAKLKAVAAFPYAQRDKADAKAAAMSKSSGLDHEVRGVKVPLSEDV